MIYFVCTLLIGYFITKIFAREIESKSLIVAFSLLSGVAVNSVLTFLLMTSHILNHKSIIVSECFLVIVLCLLFYKRQKLPSKNIVKNELPLKERIFDFSLGSLFFTLFGYSLYQLFILTKKIPFGTWDGIFIWNFHTKFFYMLNSLSADYKLFFDPVISWCHIDYPLLIPMYNFGDLIFYSEGYFPGIICCFLFYVSCVLLIYGSVKEFFGRKKGILAGLTLMTTGSLILQSASQCADVPLASYISGAFISMFLYEKYKNECFISFAFLFSSCAAFCKNEGVIFLILFSLFYLKNLKKIKKHLIFVFFPLLCVLFQKLFLSAINEYVFLQTKEHLLSNIFSINTYKFILSQYYYNVTEIPNLIIILFFALFTGINPNKKYINDIIKLFMLSGIIFIVYTFLYLISPYDILWHLETSSSRLFLQYIPLSVSGIFMLFQCGENKKDV